MDDPEPPDSEHKFQNYKEKVIKLVKYIDKTFSVDPGRVGMIFSKPLEYFSTLKKLKDYLYAQVDEKNLSISNRSQLKGLKECLEFRLIVLNCKILPLEFK